MSDEAPRILHITQERRELIETFKARRNALRLTVEDVDALAGFAPGYTTKLENPESTWGRAFGNVTLSQSVFDRPLHGASPSAGP